MSKYTIIELRHDCSAKDSILERQLWTSVVFRLKEPLFEQCRGRMNVTSFSWRFNMIRSEPCRGLIGCHNIESRFDPLTKKQVSLFYNSRSIDTLKIILRFMTLKSLLKGGKVTKSLKNPGSIIEAIEDIGI